MQTDSQLILPQFVMDQMPFVAQVIFFGALLSAIKGCASATLLAPSVSFSENILRPLLPPLNDRQLLRLMQAVTFVFCCAVLAYALHSDASIFAMVESAYQVTLVTAFVPLAFGVYWRRASNQGALCAIGAGLLVWQGMIWLGPEDPLLAPQFAGFLASLAGMLIGSLLPQYLPHNHQVHDQLHRGEHGHSAL